MDIMMQFLISELIEAEHDFQVIFPAIFRVLLTITTVLANLEIIKNMTSPAEVWANMVALGFIGDLDDSVFLIAKSGVFGTHIRKTTAEMNFSLTFTKEYPWWWNVLQQMMSGMMVVFVLIFATSVFFIQDKSCVGLHGNATLTDFPKHIETHHAHAFRAR